MEVQNRAALQINLSKPQIGQDRYQGQMPSHPPSRGQSLGATSINVFGEWHWCWMPKSGNHHPFAATKALIGPYTETSSAGNLRAKAVRQYCQGAKDRKQIFKCSKVNRLPGPGSNTAMCRKGQCNV